MIRVVVISGQAVLQHALVATLGEGFQLCVTADRKAARHEIARGQVDVAVVDLDSRFASLEHQFELHSVKVRRELSDDAVIVVGMEHKLQQVFLNILSNAVKFTPSGGSIDVMLTRTASDAQVAIKDTGEGIAPSFVPYVFDRFRQADGTSTRTHMGLGLGLAIVRRLVELHGGTVGVRSAGPGKGATFTVRLPIAPKSAIAAPEEAGAFQEKLEEPEPALTGLRILVVEDDESLQFVLREAITRYFRAA